MLYREGYVSKLRMRYLDNKLNGKLLIESIIEGPSEMKEMHDPIKEAINILLLGLPDDVYKTVDATKSANPIWEKVRRWMEGSDVGKQDKKTTIFGSLISSHPFQGNHLKCTTSNTLH
nr:hypothetical protein [Tanacetum cinerariifolium]